MKDISVITLRYLHKYQRQKMECSVIKKKKKNFNGATFSKLNSWEPFTETLLLNSKFAFQL